MIQAVLLDLDGTLLNDQKMISPKTKETLLSLQANGIRIVLASGRPKRGIEPFATELKLEQYGGTIRGVDRLVERGMCDGCDDRRDVV